MSTGNVIRIHATEPVLGAQIGKVLMRTHGVEECGGPPDPSGKPYCCIHNPSNHHMRTWDLNWRADTGVMERLCAHRIGHPDPDHLGYLKHVQDPAVEWQSIHGCDGCCRPIGEET